ncbi:MAG: SH3 domain-containing protein [Adhaeribacter sp.]
MKKLLVIFALVLQSAFVFASGTQASSGNQGNMVARANYENTKMYRQAGTSTEVLRSLKSTDEVVVIRKHNSHWSIVTVDGQVGYVLTSELHRPQEDKNIAMARPARKK